MPEPSQGFTHLTVSQPAGVFLATLVDNHATPAIARRLRIELMMLVNKQTGTPRLILSLEHTDWIDPVVIEEILIWINRKVSGEMRGHFRLCFASTAVLHQLREHDPNREFTIVETSADAVNELTS